MKNNTFFGFTILAGVAILLDACAPAYVPNVINTPLLSNKGELQASINGGISGFDPQISYALTDHIGLALNGSFANRTSDSTENYHKHNFVELGTGYYTKMGKVGRFETFGGVGFGNTRGGYSNDLWSAYTNANYTRLYLQPGIGIATAPFDGSLAARLAFVNLKQGSQRSTGVFLEPVITLKTGFKNVKLSVQIGLSFSLNENIDFNYHPFIFSIGLHTHFFRNY